MSDQRRAAVSTVTMQAGALGALLVKVAWMLGCGQGIVAAWDKETTIKRDARNILVVAEAIARESGGLPESLEALIHWGDESGPCGGGHFCHGVLDPWGHEYAYAITPDGRARVTCLGSDGRPGGDGDAADMVAMGHPREARR